jgi:hypothetical protein
MRKILPCLLALSSLTVCPGGFPAARAQVTAPTSSACAARARREFSDLMADYLRTAVSTQGDANSYTTAPTPKVFAVCINWADSRPNKRASKGFWFVTGKFSSDPTVVEQRALERCNDFKSAQAGECTCQIISRNGAMTIGFPPGWAERNC